MVPPYSRLTYSALHFVFNEGAPAAQPAFLVTSTRSRLSQHRLVRVTSESQATYQPDKKGNQVYYTFLGGGTSFNFPPFKTSTRSAI